MRWASLMWLACAAAGCGPHYGRTGGTDDAGAATDDLSALSADDGPRAPGCTDDRDCEPGQKCLDGACLIPPVPCGGDDECENDTFCQCAQGGGDGGPCVGGICRPWGTGDLPYDPDCAGRSFLASAFKPPVVKCHWMSENGGSSNVITTPLVIDLDHDHKPEILFSTYGEGDMVAIHGDTCKEIWRAPLHLVGFEQIAAADLDGDGFPEITVKLNNDLVVLDHKGNLLAQAPGAGAGCCGGPAIADVDGVAPPEIGINGSVYRYTRGQLNQLWSQPFSSGTWGTVSLFADMDGNGFPDLVTGLEVYDGRTGNDKTPANLKALGAPGAYPAIADFNKDGKPDIVLVQSGSGQQKVSVFDFANNKVIFGPYTVQDGGWGGTPTIGDYDGDGVPDFGLASSHNYYVYALKCAKQNKPKDCTGQDQGVLWQRAIHDTSSGGCGSSTFDFNGDGISEVVYRDECWLRVFNGPNGKTVFAQPITSGTALEYSVIADVDNSGHAAIVVPSDNVQGNACAGNPEGQLNMVWQAPTQGVFVLADPMNRWMPSRPLWHQHSYHITDIGDDLKVPAREKPNWLTWNNYRKNVQGTAGKAGALPDFTGGVTTQIDNGGAECSTSERLWATVCNRGGAYVPPGILGTFYSSDPRQPGAKRLCTAATTGPLDVGECEAVHCDLADPPAGPQDLWFRADDDGLTPNLVSECKPGNDLLFLPQYECRNIG